MMDKYPNSFCDRVRLLVSMYINGARVAILLIPFVMLVFFPTACYTYLDVILGGIIVTEVELTLVDRLMKSKIWREVIGTLLIYSVMILGVYITLSCLEKIIQNQEPSFSFAFNTQFLIVSAFQIIVSIVYVVTDRRVKNLSISNVTKIGYYLFPAVVGIDLGTFFAERIGVVAFALKTPAEYLWSVIVIACAFSIVYYYCIAAYHHESLLIKYKNDISLRMIMKTYRDGSVYIHYPVNDQAIGDCIEYGLLYLRSPYTVHSHNAEGAWYSIRKEHYERWNKLVQDTSPHKASVKRKNVR